MEIIARNKSRNLFDAYKQAKFCF